MIKIWNFLNGKKTYIGAAFLFTSCVLTQVVIGIWHFEPSWIHPTVKTLDWIGMAFTTTGFTHKFLKP